MACLATGTRRIPRVPLVLLSVVLPALAFVAAAGNPPHVLTEFNAAYQGKDWSRAIEVGLKLNQRVPDHPIHQYNLACVYSLSGEFEPAAEWLGKAAASGFSKLRLFETDTDLDSVRRHPGYQAALAVVKKNQARARAKLERQFIKRRPLVFLPPTFVQERAAPLIIVLHGYGGEAKGVAGQWRDVAAQAGAILAAPQAVRPVEGAGFDWGDVDEADWLIQLTLKYVQKQHNIDKNRIVLTGFSQGAFIAYSVGLRHPDLFAGVIPVAGGYVPAIDKPTKAAGDRLPCFYFMVGAHDSVAPDCRRAAKDFAAAGYHVDFRKYPGVGHAFPKDRDRELRKALKFVLGS